METYTAEQVAHAWQQGHAAALAGIHEVYLREDGAGPALDENGLPVCRFQRWQDPGDASVGIPASSGWELSKDQADTLLCKTVAEQEEIANALETVELLALLREDEGEHVTLVSDNADFNDHDNCLIICLATWTGWEDKQFEAATILDCLRAAAAEKKAFVPSAGE